METDQGTLQGFELAKEGAQRAMDHADRVNPEDGWSAQARGFMDGFIRTRPHFTSEDVWIAAEAAGIPRPPDRRAWGGIIRGFVMRKLIRNVGTARSKIPELHGNHVAVYVRA